MLRLPNPRKLGLLAWASAFYSSSATAAEIATLPDKDGPALIFVMGDIQSGDAKKFRTEAAKSDNAVVLLESEGGLVGEAIQIGEVIRLKGYATGVINGSVCNSSCGLIWLAGSPRGLSKSARVGFHAAYSRSGDSISESGVANAMVGRYLTLLNLPERVVIFATSSPPEGMNWITSANYERLGIDLKVMDDFEMSGGEPQASTVDDKGLSLWTELKKWNVYVDHSLGNKCLIGARITDGTYFRIGYSGDPSQPYYFMIQNKKWASVQEGSKYKLEVIFDGDVAWDMPVTAINLGTALALTGVFSDGTFWSDLAKAKTLLVKRDAITVTYANVEGSTAAITALASCEKSQRLEGAKDPFAK
jgi:hypothetical protein